MVDPQSEILTGKEEPFPYPVQARFIAEVLINETPGTLVDLTQAVRKHLWTYPSPITPEVKQAFKDYMEPEKLTGLIEEISGIGIDAANDYARQPHPDISLHASTDLMRITLLQDSTGEQAKMGILTAGALGERIVIESRQDTKLLERFEQIKAQHSDENLSLLEGIAKQYTPHPTLKVDPQTQIEVLQGLSQCLKITDSIAVPWKGWNSKQQNLP